jgi:antitoxin component of RelBE/YafQ-DinJ toxin-antitoxin module
MSQIKVTVRMEEETKQKAQKLFKKLGEFRIMRLKNVRNGVNV